MILRVLFSIFAGLAFSAAAQPVPVTVHATPSGQFELLRSGEPYFVRGAGGVSRLDRLALAAGNSVRTWGSEQTAAVIDEAQRLGLTVCAGLWIEHERRGFDYDDAAAVQAQIERHCRAVDQFKDKPALLLWGVGNEVESRASNPKVWDVIEAVAAYIKRVDPHHPVMTVLAHPTPAAVAEIKRCCPSVDILGCNSYAGLPVLARDVRACGWTGPYLVTEWGNDGSWEVPKTTWGAEIEPTSTAKAIQRAQRYALIRADTARCLGSYAFFWGQKQETTPTWFNLFTADGRAEESVAVLESLWSGRPPAVSAPRIGALQLNGAAAAASVQAAPGATIRAECALLRGEPGERIVRWELLR